MSWAWTKYLTWNDFRQRESVIEESLMRNAFLFFFGILLAAPLFAQNAQPSAEFVVLEVFSDHYELEGAVYQSAQDLVSALCVLKNKKGVVLQEHHYENATLEQMAAARMKKATAATKKAGFRGSLTIGYVTNELF